jgi:HK97 family phage major capsid protein
MIPSELGSRFIEKLNTYNKLRQNCTIYPSDKGTLFVENAAATNVTVAATRPPAATESVPTFTAVTYSTRGRQAWLAVDEKVVRQSPLQVLDIVLTQLAKGLTAGEYADFITGDGTTDWSGLNYYTAISSSTPAAHSTIATLDAAETVLPYWALTSPYRQGPSINKTSWVCAASYAAQLATLNAAGKEWFKFGTGVNTYMGVPIWEHASVTASGVTHPACYIGDLSQYYIFDALGTMLRTATGGKTLSVAHQILVEAYNETDARLPLTESFKSLTLHS